MGFKCYFLIQAKEIRKQTRATILLSGVVFLLIIGNVPAIFAYPAFAEKLFKLKGKLARLSSVIVVARDTHILCKL